MNVKELVICKLQFQIEEKGQKCYNIMQNKCQIVYQNWRIKMAVNYDKLWGILNERGMMKTELIKEAKISTNAMVKTWQKRRCSCRRIGEDMFGIEL